MKKLLILLPIILFLGCSSKNQGVSIAFEELGGEVGYKNGYEHTKYRSSASISGLGQNQIVGTILTVPSNRISDNYSIPIITGCSKIAVTEYADNLSDDDLIKASKALNNIISLSESLFAIKSEALIVSSLMKKLKDTNGSKEHNIAVANIKQIYSDEKTDNNLSNFLEIKMLKLTKKDSNLTQEINLQGDIFSEKVNKNGVMVTKWNSNFNSSGSTSVGEMGTLSGEKRKARTGYLILSGLKKESLWLGDDFADYISDVRKNGLTGSDSILSDYGYIVTFAIYAKKRAFVESLNYSRSLSSILNMKIEDLKKIIGEGSYSAIKDKSLEIQKRVDRLVHNSNRGIIIAPKKKLYEFRFRKDENYAKAMQAVYLRSDGYLPVYAVRSNIANLKKGVEEPSDKNGSYSCADSKDLSEFQTPIK